MTSNFFTLKDHIGTLVIFIGCELIEQVETRYGTSPAASVRYIVTVDGPRGGTVWPDQLIFGAVLIRELTKGPEMVYGRIGKGEARDGRKEPWILEPVSDRDQDLADEWTRTAVATGLLSRGSLGEAVIDEEWTA